MTGIYNGIQAILNYILAPIRFIGSLINWTNKMLEIIIETITEVLAFVTTIPNWLAALVGVSITIIVITRILGRGTGQ